MKNYQAVVLARRGRRPLRRARGPGGRPPDPVPWHRRRTHHAMTVPLSATPCAPPSAATAEHSPRCAPMTWPRCRWRRCSSAIPPWNRRPSRTCCSGAPTRRARTTATWRAWRCSWPAFRYRCPARPSIACVARAWMRWRWRRVVRAGEAEVVMRGRGVHVARAVRHASGRAPSAAARHLDDGLALRQPAAAEALRRRLDARDRRERGRAIPHRARRPGFVRLAQPAAHAGGLRAQLLRQRTHRGGDHPEARPCADRDAR